MVARAHTYTAQCNAAARRGRVSHSDVGNSCVSRRGRVFREKDRPYVQSTNGLTSFSRKDNGEFGTSRKLVGTSVRLVGGEWKIHDVAGRNRKHQDRVKRKKEHDDRGEVDHEECLKHTKKAIYPERNEG